MMAAQLSYEYYWNMEQISTNVTATVKQHCTARRGKAMPKQPKHCSRRVRMSMLFRLDRICQDKLVMGMFMERCMSIDLLKVF